MFEEISTSTFLITLLTVCVLSLAYLRYVKVNQLAMIRHRCQLTREKLNRIHLTTDVLDQEYCQLKDILASSALMDEKNLGQRLVNIENERQRSLIDQQRISTLEHLNRRLKNELNTMKVANDSLKKRLHSLSDTNYQSLPKTRRSQSPLSTRKPWPFPYFPPWIQHKLPSIHEDNRFENHRPI